MTRKTLSDFFDCRNEATLDLLELVLETGLQHGRDGWYPDGDYSSDASWCIGVGYAITQLERLLHDDSGEVFDLYCNAHAIGLNENDLGTVDAD